MKKRIKLADRILPDYCVGEEIMNMVTHIVGGGLGVIALVMCIIKAWGRGWLDMTAVILYGVSMIALYTMSSVYHGLRPGMGKKVLQVIDHCTIYLLIAGTYTPIVLIGFRPVYPAIGWGLFIVEWTLAALATIADIVPLIDENRVIAKFGLEAMAQDPRPGLRALLIGQKTAGSKGAVMELTNVAPAVKAVLDSVGFSKILTLR